MAGGDRSAQSAEARLRRFASKRELDNAGQTSLAQALEAEALAQSVNAQTADMREALMAYAERRPTNFSGQ